MNVEQLNLILQTWRQPEFDGIARESAQSEGSTYLRERIMAIAERCARDWEGDLVEIGCLNGSTTVRLAQVAKLHNRRVLAVDPWETGTQNCEGEEYERFVKIIAPHKDIVDVLRVDSRDPEVKRQLELRGICFAFVDGLHEYHAALGDIRNCYHAKLICVDDITWSKDVERAFFEGAGDRARITLPPLHEGYIL